jgi:hypothetical protein
MVRATAKQMEVQVIHGLAAVFTRVDDHSVAFGEAFIAGDCGRRVEEVSEDVAIFSTRVVERGEMFAGNNENVDRRHRMNVGEGVTQLILVDSSGGYRTVGDFAEEAGHGMTSRRVQCTTASR